MEDLIRKALVSSAKNNQGFCSEAHFQHEFALELVRLKVFKRIILERLYESKSKEGKDIYLDVWGQRNAEDGHRIGIELKYKTAELKFEICSGEFITLKNQFASDVGRYGFWDDVRRLESLIKDGHINLGYVIFLTNDSTYWESNRETLSGVKMLDYNFSLFSDREVSGELEWEISKKTKDKLKEEGKKHWTEGGHPLIKLDNKYTVPKWENFGETNFQYLLMPVCAVG